MGGEVLGGREATWLIRLGWENDDEMYLKEMRWERMDWNTCAEDGDRLL